MSVSFECPVCKTTRIVASHLVGRRVRCPDCATLVEVVPLEDRALASASAEDAGAAQTLVDPGRRTMTLVPPSNAAGETVMLESIDIIRQEEPPAPPIPPPPSPPKPPPQQLEEGPPDFGVRKSRLADTEMDMTPMVDVTFQLLIFFMITAAFALQKAKEIPKPAQEDPSTNVVQQDPEDAQDTVTVKIDELNSFTVINTDGDEDEAPSIQDLYLKLRRAKAGGSSGKVPTKMRVEAHGDALHEKVVAALDAGNETGFAELELTMASDDAE